MLLLNRGVYSGSIIMFEPAGVPEDLVPLPGAAGAPPAPDVAVRTLESPRRACPSGLSVSGGSPDFVVS